jgi:hypothetical protein
MNLLRLQYREIPRAGAGILFALLLSLGLTVRLHAQRPGTAIVVYTQPRVNPQLWPDLLQSLREDLAAGEGESPNGFVLDRNPVILLGNNDAAVNIHATQLIVVRLLGRCDVLPQSDHPSLKGPLGWVPLVSGSIEPFISVDCSRIAQVLRPISAGSNSGQRRHEMAQAIAHVVIHEWLHIATQSSAHGRKGITKQFLSVDELTAEPTKSELAIAIHE